MSTRAKAPRHLAPLLTVVLAITWLSSYAGTTTAATSSAAIAPAASATTVVTFTSNRTYDVSTRIGRKVVRGQGRLPKGLAQGNVRAWSASNVLGSRSHEVLIDYGLADQDMSAHVYSLFTVHRGSLRPVRLDGRQLVVATFTEGGDDAGFRCTGGRLVTHWFHHGSQQGEQTAYRLTGNRLKLVQQRPIGRAVASRPESCT